MKISIITATYNSGKSMTRLFQSVAMQTYADIEHILVDGGSTDNTVQAIQGNPSISRWVSERDRGVYDALNKGIRLATGAIIGFLHSDDVFASSGTVAKIAGLFSDDTVDGIYGDLVFTNSEDTVIRTWISRPFKREYIRYGWMPPHPTLFLRKAVYEKHGLFDPSFRIAGDYDFMLRVMKDTGIRLHYVPEVITIMRIGGASTGSLKGILAKSKEDLHALRKNGFRFPQLVLAIKNLRKLPQLRKR